MFNGMTMTRIRYSFSESRSLLIIPVRFRLTGTLTSPKIKNTPQSIWNDTIRASTFLLW